MKEIYEDEIGKYVKKKHSNKSKSRDKSKHKHDYSKKCLVEMNGIVYLADYCSICGKIGDPVIPTGTGIDGNHYMLSREEILNKYSKLDLIHLDYGVQYVPISKKCNKNENISDS